MPTYPVVNKETGEKKELSMTMVEYSNWRDDNPDWDRDWNAGVAGLGEVVVVGVVVVVVVVGVVVCVVVVLVCCCWCC